VFWLPAGVFWLPAEVLWFTVTVLVPDASFEPPHAATPIASADAATTTDVLDACFQLHLLLITVFLLFELGRGAKHMDSMTVTLSRPRPGRIGGSTSDHHSRDLRFAVGVIAIIGRSSPLASLDRTLTGLRRLHLGTAPPAAVLPTIEHSLAPGAGATPASSLGPRSVSFEEGISDGYVALRHLARLAR